MIHPDIASQLIDQRRIELMAEAAHHRLVRAARQAGAGRASRRQVARRWWQLVGRDNGPTLFTVKGEAPAEKLREIVEQSRARSAVSDIVTNQVPVSIGSKTE